MKKSDEKGQEAELVTFKGGQKLCMREGLRRRGPLQGREDEKRG